MTAPERDPHGLGDDVMRSAVQVVSALSPWHRRTAAAVARRRSAGVHAYVGKNGSGKSLLAALDTLPALRGLPWACDDPDHLHTRMGQTTGTVRVLATMRFTTPSGADHPLWVPLDDFDKLLHAEHCEIVIDEAGGAVASTSSSADDLPFPVKAALQEQRRKDNLVRLTAPGWMRITKTARECVGLVTEVRGTAPVAVDGSARFEGRHVMEVYNERSEVLEHLECDLDGPHEHDAARRWSSRRMHFAKTYDAAQMEEFKAGDKAKQSSHSAPRPYVRQWLWSPGSEARAAYNTFGAVLKLAQVTQGGICMVCDRPRKRTYCQDNHSPEQMAEALSRSAKALGRHDQHAHDEPPY